MLQGKHITFSYSDSAKGKIDVLKDVSFEIREHDFIGLIGTSGSGKTTLIKHLNGLLKAESGEIFFNGENIYSKKYPISKLRKEVGLVFQYPEQQLFGRTILKDVMYGPLNLGMSRKSGACRNLKRVLSFESDGTFGRSETMRCDCGSTGDAAGDIGVR